MNPNESELFVGIAGVKFEPDEYDFGNGITLRKTYAHIFAPYMAAFKPAESGQHHPGPWKAVSGGTSFDIQAEIYIPLDFGLPNWFDRLQTARWIISLIRLKASPLANVPVVTNKSFAEIPIIEEEPYFWPTEMKQQNIVPVIKPKHTILKADLNWVRDHWISAGRIMIENDDFQLAYLATDQCSWSLTPSLALVSLWGALERLFSPSHFELRFRVSSLIAAYLENPGMERLAFYHHVTKLYDERSKAAHGSPVKEEKSLLDTYTIIQRVLIQIIERNKIPSRQELEAKLFGTNFLGES